MFDPSGVTSGLINPLGLLVAANSGPTKRPIAPAALKPRAAAQASPTPTSGYTPEAVLKSQADTANWFQSRPLAPMAGGSTPAMISGGLANVGNGFMSTYLPTKAEEKMKSNSEMEQAANRAALSASTNADMAKAFSGGTPAQQSRGLEMLASERVKDREHQAQLEQQKALFEYQKKLNQDIEQQNRDRMVATIKEIAGQGGGQPSQSGPSSSAPAAPPAAVGAPDASAAMPAPTAAPVNPNADFANELLPPAGHTQPSPAMKALTAMTFGEKGKAVDALNERGEKLTEGQTKDAGFAERMLRAEAGLREVVPTDKAGTFMKYDPTKSIYKFLPDWNLTNSTEWQQYSRNAREGIAAILRKDTGAAVSDTEWAWYFPMYYPQAGDSAEVVRDKQQARIALANGLRGASGPAFDQMFPKFNDMLRARLIKSGADLTPKPPAAAPQAANSIGQSTPKAFLDGAIAAGIPRDIAARVQPGQTIRHKDTGVTYMNQGGVMVEVGKPENVLSDKDKGMINDVGAALGAS